MKNKIFIRLVVPSINERYNVMLPINKNIGNITLLLNKAISDIVGKDFIPNNNSCLYDGLTGEIITSDKFLCQTELKNGSTLILL